MTQSLRLLPRPILAFVLLAMLAVAQTKTSVPAPVPAPNRDITGMYTFIQEGEFVQVTVETYPPAGTKVGAVVTGFISRLGDLESDKGAYLDQFFIKGSLIGEKLTFTTKTIHGVWFEFTGRVERGPGKAKAEEGYYIIRGTLTRNSIDVNKKTSSQSREVTFKSFPDLDTDEPVTKSN